MKFLLLLLITATTPGIAAEFPYDAYPFADLSEITTHEDLFAKQNEIPLERRYLLLGPDRRSSVVVFAGMFREVPPHHKAFLVDLLKSMPFIPKEQIDLYTTEVLVKAGDREFWALLQGGLTQFMKDELKPGQTMKIYYFWFGAAQQDHIIAINEFSAL